MIAPVTVSEKDLRALLGVVSDDRSDLPDAGLPPSLLSELMGQIRCDVVSFFDCGPGLQEGSFLQDVPAWDYSGVDEQAAAEHYWDCAHYSYPDRSGDLRSVTKTSDFYSARQWHNAAMYRDYFRPQGMEHVLMLCLPAAPGSAPGLMVRLSFFRGPGRDFSERDRALLALLRPHLHQAYLAAERRRRGLPRLTPRHWELLRLVAAGHTNAQIARRLGVTEGTVRIHLQNIYGRLQVSSRTAAVTRAFPDLMAPCSATPWSRGRRLPIAVERQDHRNGKLAGGRA
jgi:DNA-binding CsgD family transcriptional regulator